MPVLVRPKASFFGLMMLVLVCGGSQVKESNRDLLAYFLPCVVAGGYRSSSN